MKDQEWCIKEISSGKVSIKHRFCSFSLLTSKEKSYLYLVLDMIKENMG